MSALQTLELELADDLLRLAILLALTLAVAFFVAAELAVVSASRTQIRDLAEHASEPLQRLAAQQVQDAQQHLEHYLSVTQTGTTAGSLLLGWVGEGATVHWIEPWTARLPFGHLPSVLTAHSIAVALAFLLVTYVEITVGELVPKVLATNAPERTALLLIGPLRFCSALFWPLLVILNGSVRLLTGSVKRRPMGSALPPSQAPLIQTDPHSVLVDGALDLATLNEKLGLSLPANPAYRTLAGFLINQLDRVPAQGERLLWCELELEAARVEDGRLVTVLLRRVTRPLTAPQPEAVPDLV